MKREDYISILKEINSETWVDEDGCIYNLSEEGLELMNCLKSYEYCVFIKEKEYSKLKSMLKQYHDIDICEIEGNEDFNHCVLHPNIIYGFDIDKDYSYEDPDNPRPKILMLLQKGCEAGCLYICCEGEYFDVENHGYSYVVKWETMGDSELKEWLQVYEYIKKGFYSYDDMVDSCINKEYERQLFMFYKGATYEGELKNGKMHGQGVLSDPKGRKYVGGFKKGKMHGNGVLSDPDGRKLEAIFENGEPKKNIIFTYSGGTVRKNGMFYHPDGSEFKRNYE